MAFSTQQNFMGELDGTTVTDLNKKIDYSKNKLEDRKKVVNEILSNTKFYEEYFSEHFKAGITCGDALSDNVNVCKSLERMANYLLNSKEIKQEEDEEKLQYVFHTDSSYFQRKVNRESSVVDGNGNDALSDGAIDFLVKERPNSKKSKKQSIRPKDLQRTDELGQILRDYNVLLQRVTHQLKNPETKTTNRYLLTKTSHEVSADMVYCKDTLLGVFGYDPTVDESTEYDLDFLDFSNEAHVKALLPFKPEFDPNSEFKIILVDFQNVVNKTSLTEKEKDVLELLRMSTKNSEIAEHLNTYRMDITHTINRIAKKISRVGDKYCSQ